MVDTPPLIRLGTHDGNFHGDDILAMSILTTIYPHHQIIRSRDEDILDLCDILVDVGGRYDHFGGRYDHHLPSPPMVKNRHVLSSAGLIWKHYSKDYLTAIGMPKSFVYKDKTINLHDEIDNNIHTHWIVPIDRLDNGLVQGFTAISEVVRSFRPTDPQKSREAFDQTFLETVSFVRHMFKRSCFHSADYLIGKIKYQMEEKMILDDGKIIVSVHPVHGMKSFMTTLAHFVVYPSLEYKDVDPQFVVRPVSDPVTKQFKTMFPETVLGHRNAVIERELGIEGVSYIHHSGFMALTQSEDSAIALCRHLLSSSQI